MKTLIFLFMGFFCFANSQIDSLRIVQKLDRLEQVNNETKVLLKKAASIDKENQSLIYRIKIYIKKLTNQNKYSESKELKDQLTNSQGIKPSNINEPILEVNIPDGYDTIKGNFFYRLFHKEKVYLRAYKLLNDEKIYMD